MLRAETRRTPVKNDYPDNHYKMSAVANVTAILFTSTYCSIFFMTDTTKDNYVDVCEDIKWTTYGDDCNKPPGETVSKYMGCKRSSDEDGICVCELEKLYWANWCAKIDEREKESLCKLRINVFGKTIDLDDADMFQEKCFDRFCEDAFCWGNWPWPLESVREDVYFRG